MVVSAMLAVLDVMLIYGIITEPPSETQILSFRWSLKRNFGNRGTRAAVGASVSNELPAQLLTLPLFQPLAHASVARLLPEGNDKQMSPQGLAHEN